MHTYLYMFSTDANKRNVETVSLYVQAETRKQIQTGVDRQTAKHTRTYPQTVLVLIDIHRRPRDYATVYANHVALYLGDTDVTLHRKSKSVEFQPCLRASHFALACHHWVSVSMVIGFSSRNCRWSERWPGGIGYFNSVLIYKVCIIKSTLCIIKNLIVCF